jgi:hypothetical protein
LVDAFENGGRRQASEQNAQRAAHHIPAQARRKRDAIDSLEMETKPIEFKAVHGFSPACHYVHVV